MVKEQLAENQLSPEITLGCTGKIRSQSTQQRQDGNLLLVNMVNNLALPVSMPFVLRLTYSHHDVLPPQPSE